MNTKVKLVNAVLESASSSMSSNNKRLTCVEAFKLAKEFRAEIIEIGHICNENNIRICECQLGCFK